MNPIKMDGNEVYSSCKSELKSFFSDANNGSTSKPKLVIFLIGDDPASILYTNLKKRDCEEIGVDCEIIKLDSSTSQDLVIERIDEYNNDSSCTGIMVQLPVPSHIDANKVINSIDPRKDVDGLSPVNLGFLASNYDDDSYLAPCTPLAIIELGKYYGVDFKGKNVVILGRGKTVGRPLQLLLSNNKYNATTTLIHSKTQDIKKYTREADIVISAMGAANFIKESDVKNGAVLFNVGITKEGKKIIGDIEESCYKKSSLYAPVVGGVGPVTRAMLLKNLAKIYKNNQ